MGLVFKAKYIYTTGWLVQVSAKSSLE